MPAGSFALQARPVARPAGNPVAGLLPASILDHGYPCVPGAEGTRGADSANGYGRRFASQFAGWCANAATQVADQATSMFANLSASLKHSLKQEFAG